MLLVYKTTILKGICSSDQPYPLVLIKHLLIHRLLQVFCHCTVYKWVRWAAITFVGLCACFNYNASFSPVHLVFLELDIYQPHLDFKIPDENNNEVILRIFFLQLLNKEWAYTKWNENLIGLKPYSTTRTRIISLKQIERNWGIFS